MINKTIKLNNNLLYLLIVICSTLSILVGYNFKIDMNRDKTEPGFMGSKPFLNDGTLCKAGSDDALCIKDIIDDFSSNQRNILFLGNSQTGAVNDFSIDDINYVTIIKNQFYKNNNHKKIKGIWFPNANIIEFEKINLLLEACNINIELLIIPVFLDDMRDYSVRNKIKEYSENNCFSNNLSEKNKPLKFGNLVISNNKIKSKIFIFSKLENLNKYFRLDLYKLRNWIFNIKPESIRKLRPAAYKSNINALKNILNNRNIYSQRTIVYIPPLLNYENQKKIPYDRREYKKFKTDIENLCKEYFCDFYNLETLVPDQFWGFKSSTSLFSEEKEIDFMHFTAKGHQIMATKFLEILYEHKKLKE